jgi:hypothetical protein
MISRRCISVHKQISTTGLSPHSKYNMYTTHHHPANQPLIDIVGTHASSSGRSCEEHKCCGKCVIALDVVLRLRSVQVNIDGVERPAVAAYWVTDGIDRCRVGFIKAELTETQSSREEYDGRLVQVVAICRKNSESSEDRAAARRYFGCCRAAFIETRKENSKVTKKDNSRGENNQAVQQEEGSRKKKRTYAALHDNLSSSDNE